MSSERTAIPDTWERVAERWRRSNIAPSLGATDESLALFESRFQVSLPTDVRRYFGLLNGTGQDMDDDMYRFWPLSEVKPVHEELSDANGVKYPDRFAYPDCYVFADYLISSWLYAVKITDDPTQPAPVFRVTASDTPGEQMASSFSEFMSRYADDPNSVI